MRGESLLIGLVLIALTIWAAHFSGLLALGLFIMACSFLNYYDHG